MALPEIVCTAESFGYGPAAALHQIATHLRESGYRLRYVGTGISLEMHVQQDYTDVTACDVQKPEGAARLRALLAPHSVVLSVCDVQAAAVAKGAGCRVALYDPLSWFRKPLPEACRKVDLYLCPDFLGVRQRLLDENLPNARVVPPLIPEPLAHVAPSDAVLINLGGLRTPHFDVQACVLYAQLCVDAVAACLPADQQAQVVVSRDVGRHLGRCITRTVTPQQARYLLASSGRVFATVGLGNIFDVAGLAARGFFLPPVSFSQGQQMHLLRAHGLMAWGVDWHDIVDLPPLDYSDFSAPVLRGIGERLQRLRASAAAQQRLKEVVQRFLRHPDPRSDGLQTLVATLGRDDGLTAATRIAAALS